MPPRSRIKGEGRFQHLPRAGDGVAGALLVALMVLGAPLATGMELSGEWRGWEEESRNGGKGGERRGKWVGGTHKMSWRGSGPP